MMIFRLYIKLSLTIKIGGKSEHVFKTFRLCENFKNLTIFCPRTVWVRKLKHDTP